MEGHSQCVFSKFRLWVTSEGPWLTSQLLNFSASLSSFRKQENYHYSSDSGDSMTGNIKHRA